MPELSFLGNDFCRAKKTIPVGVKNSVEQVNFGLADLSRDCTAYHPTKLVLPDLSAFQHAWVSICKSQCFTRKHHMPLVDSQFQAGRMRLVSTAVSSQADSVCVWTNWRESSMPGGHCRIYLLISEATVRGSQKSFSLIMMSSRSPAWWDRMSCRALTSLMRRCANLCGKNLQYIYLLRAYSQVLNKCYCA